MKSNTFLLAILFLINVIFIACGESDNPGGRNPGIPPAPTNANRTVLAYIAADNSLSRFALEDLAEMVEGAASVNTDANNLLAYVDSQNDAPKLYWLKKNSQGQVEKIIIKDYDDRNSVGLSEMKEVVAFAFDEYKANSYGFIYWSHGDGWIPYPLTNSRWIGEDLTGGTNRMNISQFKEVLSVAPHLDFLMFDACFMQSIEVAYELKDEADFILASPTEIPGPGAPYQVVVPSIFDRGSAIDIAAAYYDFYESKYNGGANNSNANWTGGVSMSVIKTSELNQLAGLTRDIYSTYFSNTVNLGEILCYDLRSSEYYYDLDKYIKTMTGGNADYNAWKEKFDKVQPYFKTTAKNYSAFGGMFSMSGAAGISTFIPQHVTQVLKNNYKNTEWAKATGLNTLID